jgi:phosphoserine aminotransferase
MAGRVFNFSAGPCTLPVEILERAAGEMTNWHGTGLSVAEMSHRGKEFMSIIKKTEADLRELMHIPTNYHILFTAGGATL